MRMITKQFLFAAMISLTLVGCAGKKVDKDAASENAPKSEAALDSQAEIQAAPEPATLTITVPAVIPVSAEKHMVATANPFATEAALEMLRAGGSAIDAAIAAQMVLTLVEPQSSGIGGGAFLMYYDAASGDIGAYDGRETAPASATPDMFLNDAGEPMKFYEAVVGGTSVGVPGVLRMMELAHGEYGKLPWAQLFEPAILLSRDGFPVSPRMSEMVAGDKYLKTFEGAAGYFYDENGESYQPGSILQNPDLTDTFETIARKGADAFYEGDIGADIVAHVRTSELHPSGMTTDDLSGYTALKRAPSCMPYRDYLVCGMPPPSSGGITTLQILGILQNFDMATFKPNSVEAVHLISEAGRLAFADRNTYLADPDFFPAPPGMLGPAYLELRAREISTRASMGKAQPGMPGFGANNKWSPDAVEKGISTTHLSIIDSAGNALSMTSSIENKFGSRMMVRGFLLNNQLTDFSFRAEKGGVPVANQVEPGKRPRSSMAPTLVFDATGDVVLAIGSPGGSSIIGYVANTLVGTIDWGMNVQEVVNMPHYLNKNGKTYLEKGTSVEQLEPALSALGHDVSVRTLNSGLHGVAVSDGVLFGGADPRREGVAAGD